VVSKAEAEVRDIVGNQHYSLWDKLHLGIKLTHLDTKLIKITLFFKSVISLQCILICLLGLRIADGRQVHRDFGEGRRARERRVPQNRAGTELSR
jgi:hypothetical protein